MPFSVTKGENTVINYAGDDQHEITNQVHIKCGDNCTVNLGRLRSIGGSLVIIANNDCVIDIGDGIIIPGKLTINMNESGSTVRIGKDCLFSSSQIWTSDFHSIIDLDSGQRINPAGSVTIGDHVWVGNDALFLKNSGIGNNSVVATRAVVTKSHGDNIVIGGNPAVILKENTTWDIQKL